MRETLNPMLLRTRFSPVGRLFGDVLVDGWSLVNVPLRMSNIGDEVHLSGRWVRIGQVMLYDDRVL